jgi:hypothetical protein
MWKKMTRALNFIMIILCIVSTLACTHVNPDLLYGTYVAAYPFGTDTLTIGREGHFSQRIEVTGQGAQTFNGTWQYSQKDSSIEFHGIGSVADGFGHLKNDWRTDVIENSFQAVERSWFKIVINSGARVPYVKQRL